VVILWKSDPQNAIISSANVLVERALFAKKDILHGAEIFVQPVHHSFGVITLESVGEVANGP